MSGPFTDSVRLVVEERLHPVTIHVIGSMPKLLPNSVRKLAVLLILVGGLLLVGPSFGFSSFAADRGVVATTAEGSAAYLGIESEGDITGTELRGDSDPLQVGTLYNNVDEDLEIRDVVVDSIGDDTVDDDIVTVAAPDPGKVIERNGSTAVMIECADDTSVGEQDIVVRVDRVTGAGISIAGPTFTATVDVQCGKGKFSGSANLNVSDVGTGDTTQTVSFDVGAVKNNDEVTIDFSNPQRNGGVDYSAVTDDDLTVRSQGHGGTVTFDSETSQLTYSPQGNEGGTLSIEIANIDVVGDPGKSYPVSYSDTTGRDDGDFFDIM